MVEELKEELKTVPNEEKIRAEKQMLIETLIQLNERITNIEKRLQPQPVAPPLQQPLQQQQNLDTNTIALLASLFGGSQHSTEQDLKDLVFNKFVEQSVKSLAPTRKEVKGMYRHER